MLLKCFNVSVEGQPLQQQRARLVELIPHKFQSLCRGTAIATANFTVRLSRISLFQSLCRGTAIATPFSPLPLSPAVSFNPSVEGQPLQQPKHWLRDLISVCFNPSVEGQPLQLRSCYLCFHSYQPWVSIPLSRDSHCNPSSGHFMRAIKAVSIPLSRDSHCN